MLALYKFIIIIIIAVGFSIKVSWDVQLVIQNMSNKINCHIMKVLMVRLCPALKKTFIHVFIHVFCCKTPNRLRLFHCSK